MVDLRLSTGKLIRDNFEAELRNLFARATDDSKNLNYALLSRKRELEEQRQISVVSVPYLGVTGIVLTLFMLVTLVDFPLHKSQHIEVRKCYKKLYFQLFLNLYRYILGHFRSNFPSNGPGYNIRLSLGYRHTIFEHLNRCSILGYDNRD